MPVVIPLITTVSPGQPVTAQGWNALVEGLLGLIEAVNALGGVTLDVQVTDGTTPLPGAVVVAEPLGAGDTVQALPPFGTRSAHLLAGLTDGPWRVHIRAAGYSTEVREITMPRVDPLAVAMTVAGVRVPDLFGVVARGALDQLRAAGIEADIILDTTGREVSRTALPPEYVDSPILSQLPAAGTVVPAGTGRVRLVVASALRREPVVTMPSLIGLTLGEANAALERLGLRVGVSNVRD